MNVAIDSGPLESEHKVRGIGFQTQEFLSAIEKERIGLEKLNIDAFNFSQNKGSLASSRYDIVHCTDFKPYFITLPKKVGGKLVVTIDDLIPLIYPKHYPGGFRGKIRFQVQKFLLKKAAAIITISECSKKDIVRFLKIDPSKIHVLHLAPRNIYKIVKNKTQLSQVKKDYHLPNKFVLYVGDINYNKNISTLIDACNKLEIKLFIAGKQALDIENRSMDLITMNGPKDWIRFLLDIPHPELAHFENIRNNIKSSNNVRCLGFVPDEDLVAIYNLATVYCQPSFYEGFGMTVLEAMASGTSVVISKTNALVEISKDAALMFEPKNPDELAEIIAKIIKDDSLAAQLSSKGLKVAASYSWKINAKKTIEIYKSVLKDGKKRTY
jgi:glycosyltransferase involved in cell wall biosynthesis